jgi:predicted transglutaminase-like protease
MGIILLITTVIFGILEKLYATSCINFIICHTFSFHSELDFYAILKYFWTIKGILECKFGHGDQMIFQCLKVWNLLMTLLATNSICNGVPISQVFNHRA